MVLSTASWKKTLYLLRLEGSNFYAQYRLHIQLVKSKGKSMKTYNLETLLLLK